jgi:hypothetical protein
MPDKLSVDRLRILPADDEQPQEDIATMPLVGAMSKPAENLTEHRFVAVGEVVMNGQIFIGAMRSHTMAKRAANALNTYKPGPKGY